MLDRRYKNLIKYVWGNDEFQELPQLAQEVLFLLARGENPGIILLEHLIAHDNPEESLDTLNTLIERGYIDITFVGSNDKE